jgi:hypothetical protein
MYRQTVHRGGVLAGEVMLAPMKRIFSWSWHHGRRGRRLELGYYQKPSLVLEIPAIFAYIDFEGPPDRSKSPKSEGVRRVWTRTSAVRLARMGRIGDPHGYYQHIPSPVGFP